MDVCRELRSSEEGNAEGLWFDVGADSNGIELFRLDVESEFRWKGVATRFMQKLAELADKYQLPIELEVGSGTDDTNIIEDLPRFYNRFGFEWKNGYMRRECQKT